MSLDGRMDSMGQLVMAKPEAAGVMGLVQPEIYQLSDKHVRHAENGLKKMESVVNKLELKDVNLTVIPHYDNYGKVPWFNFYVGVKDDTKHKLIGRMQEEGFRLNTIKTLPNGYIGLYFMFRSGGML